MRYPFRHPIVVRFADCDPAGVLFFARMFDLSHSTLESFLVALGIPWKSWFTSERWAVPLVHSEADYLKPMPAGEAVDVVVSVVKVGTSSCTFSFRFEDSGVCCATVQTSHVFVAKSDFHPIPIPAEIRSVLEAAMHSQEPNDAVAG